MMAEFVTTKELTWINKCQVSVQLLRLLFHSYPTKV